MLTAPERLRRLEEALDKMLQTQVDLLHAAKTSNKLLAQIRDALTEPVMRDTNYFEKDR